MRALRLWTATRDISCCSFPFFFFLSLFCAFFFLFSCIFYFFSVLIFFFYVFRLLRVWIHVNTHLRTHLWNAMMQDLLPLLGWAGGFHLKCCLSSCFYSWATALRIGYSESPGRSTPKLGNKKGNVQTTLHTQCYNTSTQTRPQTIRVIITLVAYNVSMHVWYRGTHFLLPCLGVHYDLFKKVCTESQPP